VVSSRALKNLDDAAFQAVVEKRRRARMAEIDRMAPDLRALVHDYGLNTVRAFLDVGVQKPKHIRHLVETVLNEFSPTRGGGSAQGIRADFGIRANHPLNK
jgi:hypothetical protein